MSKMKLNNQKTIPELIAG